MHAIQRSAVQIGIASKMIYNGPQISYRKRLAE